MRNSCDIYTLLSSLIPFYLFCPEIPTVLSGWEIFVGIVSMFKTISGEKVHSFHIKFDKKTEKPIFVFY